MPAFARCLLKRALLRPGMSLRSFHSPYVVLRDSSLTAPPPPSSSMYEKQHDHSAEPFVTHGGTRTYVVSEPDASSKYYQVPSGAYPTSVPYEATSIAGAQTLSTSSNLYKHPVTMHGGESSTVRSAISHGEANKADGSSGAGKANTIMNQNWLDVAGRVAKAGLVDTWRTRR